MGSERSSNSVMVEIKNILLCVLQARMTAVIPGSSFRWPMTMFVSRVSIAFMGSCPIQSALVLDRREDQWDDL